MNRNDGDIGLLLVMCRLVLCRFLIIIWCSVLLWLLCNVAVFFGNIICSRL